MKKSAQQIQAELAALTQELADALAREANPQPELLLNDGTVWWPRTETSFVYNGIARKGIVVGFQSGRFTTLVEVLETWNERDGDQDEPTYKLFSSDQIRSYRVKA